MNNSSLAAALADRYRIERELGADGMATVYLAEDVRHRRKVAIKVLHAERAAVRSTSARLAMPPCAPTTRSTLIPRTA